ncbi:hypothetical protein [Pseudaestuariivita rosea]|uniref:hypothetical protein n=1 Tax=Pseudaestuariivita rosea TaxID=2763263 RepID=UPI001ABA65CF|nr:hypothetical protein [Pseudaestuariivita rosea]
MKFTPRLAIALFGFAGLAACSNSESDNTPPLPKETQVAAFKQCSAELNIPLQLQYLDRRGGGVHIFMVNGNGVTLADARSMNKCARAKLSDA